MVDQAVLLLRCLVGTAAPSVLHHCLMQPCFVSDCPTSPVEALVLIPYEPGSPGLRHKSWCRWQVGRFATLVQCAQLRMAPRTQGPLASQFSSHSTVCIAESLSLCETTRLGHSTSANPPDCVQRNLLLCRDCCPILQAQSSTSCVLAAQRSIFAKSYSSRAQFRWACSHAKLYKPVTIAESQSLRADGQIQLSPATQGQQVTFSSTP